MLVPVTTCQREQRVWRNSLLKISSLLVNAHMLLDAVVNVFSAPRVLYAFLKPSEICNQIYRLEVAPDQPTLKLGGQIPSVQYMIFIAQIPAVHQHYSFA